MTPPDPAALGCADLHFQVGAAQILRGIDLAVARGEVLAVVGPSGSGKSTLLHLLGGLERPSWGQVSWGSDRVDQLSVEARARLRAEHLGLIFQHHYLLPDLSVLANVQVPALVLRRDETRHARALLERVGLAGRERAMPQDLSGGERQRVALARALALRPRALLADEPTGSLDRANAAAVAGMLFELAHEHGSGVVLVTHDDALAARADRTLHLLDGRIVDGVVTDQLAALDMSAPDAERQ